MELSDHLAGENALVRAKEAEALAILVAHAGPAKETFDAAKRAYGDILRLGELGSFIDPADAARFYEGRKKATRFLFDAYAGLVFNGVFDAETFITLLDPIRERVREKLEVLDRNEASLCRLAWEKLAWERAKPSAIRSAWRRLRTLWKGGALGAPVRGAGMDSENATPKRPPAAGDSLLPDPAVGGASTPEDVPTALAGTVASHYDGTDRSAIVDAFLLRCNQEPDLTERVIRTHIWRAVGHRKPRQFQYWQAGNVKATAEDDRNFRRILEMNPADFVTLLRQKRLISAKP
jgi:hypothetical protein